MVPILILHLWRNHFVKDKRNFPFHYVFLGGIAGLLPDIDLLIWGGARIFQDIALHEVHRTFTHTLFVPLIFFLLGFVFWNTKCAWIDKHRMKLRWVFIIIGFGVSTHLLLDFLDIGQIMPFYPFSMWKTGMNYLGKIGGMDAAIWLDAFLLALWLAYAELRHNISSIFR